MPAHTTERLRTTEEFLAERKRGEEERERLMAQLRTLNAELEERVETRTAELITTIKERDVLLQEVHHRVKNNLQVISSLIKLQMRTLVDAASREALADCQARVEAMALIHEKLYQSGDYSRVAFSDYARGLATSVFQATGASPPGVSLELAIEDTFLAVDRAIPCGLILNELITNALKHAFPGGRRGALRVELKRVEGQGLQLAVGDDGIGLPAGLDVKSATSLGLQLVRLLSTQLNADLAVEATRGTCFRLTFPDP